MTDGVNREHLLGLLEKLGSDADEEALSAARELHEQVTAAGAQWEDLLAPVRAPSDDETIEDVEPTEASRASKPAPDDAASLKLIEQLRSRKGTSKEFREELDGYKEDIAEGLFEDMDRQYLRALHERLTKR